MPSARIAVIEGDGIGKEVVPEGVKVVQAAARVFGLALDWEHFDWGCDHHARFGRMMPQNGLDRIAGHDAIFLGAIGWPTVSDVESLWTLLMPIRRNFQQYVNLRPVRLFEGVPSPLADPGAIDFCIVRENNEGEYSEVGGRMFPGTDQEMVIQDTVMTRFGCDRVMRFAFELARKRKNRLTSATKSNGIIHTMPFWDERFRAVAREFPDVATEQYHIDILTAHFVRRPSSFDVVVAGNLFGDILSDLGPAVTGTIGIAPSGNLNPERKFPSMFEPVHGSAPDIAGRNIANPIGQIWSGAMMLEHLGARDAGAAIVAAIERVLASGENLTPDMGGTGSTSALGQAIADAVSIHPAEARRHGYIAFVDTHFHLHDMKHKQLRYGWLEPEAVHGFLPDTDPLKSQHYFIKDFLAEIRFANVPKAVHVQAAVNTPDPVVETAWLQAFADQTGYPHGIVAECHLARPDAAQVLDRHLQFKNLRGIRNFGEGRYLIDAAWRRGFAELAPRKLVSCIDTRVELAGDILDLAGAFPETQICIDHCAIPLGRDEASFRRWRAAMDTMAKSANVTMKISGLGMGDPLWTVASIRPYVLGSIEAFGTDRVVFGSNWPVDRMFSSYPDVIDAYAEIISGFSKAERVAMFSGNAERLFRI